jgi:hypothetical protein
MDSFRESMDSYRIVTYESGLPKIRFVPTIRILILGFVSFRFVTAVLKYPYRGFVSDNTISKYIRESFRILTNPPNPYESTESLRIHRILTNPLRDSRIQMKGFANPHLVNNEAKLFQPILLLSFGTNGMYIVKKSQNDIFIA